VEWAAVGWDWVAVLEGERWDLMVAQVYNLPVYNNKIEGCHAKSLGILQFFDLFIKFLGAKG
jgi:hypothetical protein